MENLTTNSDNEQGVWLQNTNTLRKLIGILGISLPFLLPLALFVYHGNKEVLDSISHYYYTRANGIFVIVVSIVGLFLIIYRCYDDFWISTVAGIAALCVVLFPTNNIAYDSTKPDYVVTIIKSDSFRETFHFIAAGVFLGCLAFMSLFRFTKSNKKATKIATPKKIRNRVYRTCGILMVLACLTIAFFNSKSWYEKYHITFYMEAVAVVCFGISWLVKGETIFKDKEVE